MSSPDDDGPDEEDDDDLPDGTTYADFLQAHLDVLRQQSADYLLRILVDVVNRGRLSFDITVTVGGKLVSGHLVSAATWFDGVASLIDIQGGEGGVALSIPFRQLRDDYRVHGMLSGLEWEIKADSESEEGTKPVGSSDSLPVFIHLKDAAIWHGSTDLRVGYWRGRLCEVQGWSLGRMGPPSPDPLTPLP